MEDIVVLWLRSAAVFHMHPNFSRQMVLKLANKTVLKSFYAPEGTSGGILKSHRQSVHYKLCLSDSSKTTERVEHN